MRCPSCQQPIAESTAACGHCGFSLSGLDKHLGIPPMLNAPLADQSGVLSNREKKSVRKAVQILEQRFPQITFAAVLSKLPPEISPSVYAFWLFNRASLFSAVEREGDNHGVLLLLDTEQTRAAAMIGYGLEPLVSEMILEVCLRPASRSLSNQDYGHAIEAFVRELEKQLIPLCEKLPTTFGYREDIEWQDSSTGEIHQPMRMTDSIDPY